MRKASQWVTVVYFLSCLSPYFIPSMNVLDPKIGDIPFTLWWSMLMVTIYCFFLKFWSVKLWDSFDGGEKEVDE